jgi:hypothetical protein
VRDTPVLITLLFLCALLGLSCNKEFSPKGPFQDQLVVYSVLSNERDLQYVRVYSNYDVPGYDPFVSTADRQILGAQVIVSAAGETHVFRDTLLPRADTSRYKTPIHAYVSNWQPQQGQIYNLQVAAGSGVTNASNVSVPAKPTRLEIINRGILDDPPDANTPTGIYFSALLNPTAKGFSCKMFIEYAVTTAAGSKTQQVEVMDNVYTITPLISRNQNNSAWLMRNRNAYVFALSSVLNKNRGQQVVFKRVIFRLLQFEQNMYDYYSIVHSFQDPFSIRFDEPDYTNLSNGYGLFGAYSLDSLVHIYPDDFAFNRR